MESNSLSSRSTRAVQLEFNIKQSYKVKLFICSFAFSISTIVLLWEQNGLTLSDVFLLQAIFSLTSAAVEVPTGYFADSMGRKTSMMIGALLLCIGAGMYCFISTFTFFLIAEVLLAIGMSLTSGADEALVHDSLLELERESEFGAIWGKINLSIFFGLSVFAALGGIVSVYWIRLPSYLAFAGMCYLLFVIFGLIEPYKEKIASKHSSFREILNISRFCFLENKRVRWLILFPAILLACVQSSFWLYQPYFIAVNISQVYFGCIYAFFNIVAGIGSWRIAKYLFSKNEKNIAGLFVFLTAISFVLLSKYASLYSFLFAGLHQVVRGATPVIFSTHLNKEVSSEKRATILSIRSMASKLVYALILFPLNVYGDSLGVFKTYACLAVITMCIGSFSIVLLYSKTKR